ncbi:ATP-binding protein [Streptomyces sp. NRRL B-1347]|uniref:ATP-binding protein n=1 Tax=Streptomyces sp. NRRL B-1347 TaxID=1476877 RepID=UPI0004CB26E0|nr:ATP-binding protein [Streptomyces sp. NRRL B-1347]
MAAPRIALSVRVTAGSVTTARHRVVRVIHGWEPKLEPDVVHTAELVLSELLTNAVRHTGTARVSVSARLLETALHIEVHDSSRALPRPSTPSTTSEDGRGLLLVAALAARFGAEPTLTGKRVWAEVALRPSDTGPLER